MPAPLGPTRQYIEPFSTLKEILLRTYRDPYRFSRSIATTLYSGG
ncbi:MAG: hypothetical protein RQ885_10815 [Desulfurococcales archaeon]|nr:hypothetical protein [Desulfurococcales archaeon]